MGAHGVNDANCGIYKIVSPTGRVYIGQSIDIRARFAKYKGMHCSGQHRLYASFCKHGVENHVFEIIEICSHVNLNKKERQWQEKYNVLGDNGLNCKYTNVDEKSGKLSEQTKRKISDSHKGKSHSEESKKKMSQAKLGKRMPEEQRIKMIGRKLPESTIVKMKERMKGNQNTKGIVPVNARKVVDTKTGNVFDSVTIAANHFGYKPRTLTAWLDGQNKNKTSLRFLNE